MKEILQKQEIQKSKRHFKQTEMWDWLRVVRSKEGNEINTLSTETTQTH